jgi:tetratricopeptide (TPR) repeat protein
MSLDSDIARGQALLAAGDMPGLTAALPALEAAKPATEPQWDALCKIFNTINRPAWAEIMTDRFLFEQPANISGRLQQVLFMTQAELRRDEALRKLDDLTGLPFDKPDHYLKLSEIYTNCGDSQAALVWLRKAKTAYPDNTYIWIVIIQSLMRLGQTSRLRSELAVLRVDGRGNAERLLLVSMMALWNKENALALQVVKEIEPLLEPDRHQDRAMFMVHAQRVDHYDMVLRNLPLLDIKQLWSQHLLEDLYLTLEGRGLMDAERAIIARALELYPQDEAFMRRAKAVGSFRSDFLPVMVAPMPVSPPKQSGLLSRLRNRFAGR